MATTLRIRRRAAGGAAGAPASLKSAELAYNMADGNFYAGFGDDGSGNATSVRKFASDDHIGNLPTGGAANQVLAKASGADGDFIWADPATGGTNYTASENGIELVGSQFSLNFSEIDTALTLTTRLAGKANTSHTHDASEITSGVLDIARIPVLPGNQTVVSTGGIANLDAGQQAAVEEGTIVTTTDGQRWVYSGTGSKTDEASYVSLADITPLWANIENKPAFATVATSGSYNDLTDLPSLALVATSGSYNDLSNLPTLGSMAAQNAGSVAITGGTIDGVEFDGGVF